MKNFILLLIFLFSININAQINRNHHTSYSENIIQSLKLEDGRMLILFSEHRNESYCSWAKLALFDMEGEIIWRNELIDTIISPFVDYKVHLDSEFAFFSVNESMNEVIVHSNEFICCHDLDQNMDDIFLLKISLDSGTELNKFMFNYNYVLNPKTKIISLDNEHYIVAQSNDYYDIFRLIRYNNVNGEKLLLSTSLTSEIIFLQRVNDTLFIAGDSNNLFLINKDGLVVDSLQLSENFSYRQLLPNKIEAFSNTTYLIIDENLNILENLNLTNESEKLIDVHLQNDHVYYLYETDVLLNNSIPQIKLAKKSLFSQDSIEVDFIPEDFQPNRILLDQNKIRMFGTEHHGKNYGLTIIDCETATLETLTQTNKDLEILSISFEIVSFYQLQHTEVNKIAFRAYATIKNNKSPVDSFNISFKSQFNLDVFYTYECIKSLRNNHFNISVATNETITVDLGLYLMHAYPTSNETFEMGGCAWVSAPDGKTDDVDENDMICKTELVTSVQNIEATSFKVYPNPTFDLIYIENGFNTKNVQYNIINTQGKLVQAGSLNEENTITVQHLKSGIYMLQLFDDENQFQNVKIIKY